MPESAYIVSNGYSLTGGVFDSIAVSEFDDFGMSVETTTNSIGMDSRGNAILGSLAGEKKFETPTFVCPLNKESYQKLTEWIIKMYPAEGRQVKHEPEDLIFSLRDEGKVVSSWRLLGAYPMKYKMSKSGLEGADIAKITMTLSITETVPG